jgi:hypothetical protein
MLPSTLRVGARAGWHQAAEDIWHQSKEQEENLLLKIFCRLYEYRACRVLVVV